jgi:hypothetical protein
MHAKLVEEHGSGHKRALSRPLPCNRELTVDELLMSVTTAMGERGSSAKRNATKGNARGGGSSSQAYSAGSSSYTAGYPAARKRPLLASDCVCITMSPSLWHCLSCCVRTSHHCTCTCCTCGLYFCYLCTVARVCVRALCRVSTAGWLFIRMFGRKKAQNFPPPAGSLRQRLRRARTFSSHS